MGAVCSSCPGSAAESNANQFSAEPIPDRGVVLLGAAPQLSVEEKLADNQVVEKLVEDKAVEKLAEDEAKETIAEDKVEDKPVEAEAPGKGLTILFADEGSEDVSVTFPSKPLGFNWAHDIVPVRVNKIRDGGDAQRFGVKVGMVIKAVAGVPTDGLQYGEIRQKIVDGIKVMS